MRDIHIGKRGSDTANEEQLDKLRKTVRRDLPIRRCLWNILRVVRNKIGPLLCRVQVMSMTTLISALDAFHEMDGPKSCIREVLDWYRGEDAGCLRRSALNVSVENMTCLNALEGESWKIWNEELVQNSVMNA